MKRKTGSKISGVVMSVLMVTSMITGCQFEESHSVLERAQAPSGLAITVPEGQGMKLTQTKLMTSEYEAYGVSEQAESAYTLTATVTPADAANKKVDWTVAFKNPSYIWATGKTVTDYVTVTPISDGALTAVVENKAAFGAQIVVKATSQENSEATASCTLDYRARVIDAVPYFGGTCISHSDSSKCLQTFICAVNEGVMNLTLGDDTKETVYEDHTYIFPMDAGFVLEGAEVDLIYSDHTIKSSYSFQVTYQIAPEFMALWNELGGDDFLNGGTAYGNTQGQWSMPEPAAYLQAPSEYFFFGRYVCFNPADESVDWSSLLHIGSTELIDSVLDEVYTQYNNGATEERDNTILTMTLSVYSYPNATPEGGVGEAVLELTIPFKFKIEGTWS